MAQYAVSVILYRLEKSEVNIDPDRKFTPVPVAHLWNGATSKKEATDQYNTAVKSLKKD